MASQGVVDKGLKKDALGLRLQRRDRRRLDRAGLLAGRGAHVVVAAVGLQAPAVLILAFMPMLLHRGVVLLHEPRRPGLRHHVLVGDARDGPVGGWIGGWAIIVADIIVMANLAQIAGLYRFLLVGWQSAAESTFAVTAVGACGSR